MSFIYDTHGSNWNYCWAYLQYEYRPGLSWRVVGLDPWTTGGWAVVDDFGTLVPVK